MVGREAEDILVLTPCYAHFELTSMLSTTSFISSGNKWCLYPESCVGFSGELVCSVIGILCAGSKA